MVQLSENIRYTRHYTSLTYAISSFYKPKDKEAKDYQAQLVEATKKIQNTLCQHIELDIERHYHLFAIDVTPNLNSPKSLKFLNIKTFCQKNR